MNLGVFNAYNQNLNNMDDGFSPGSVNKRCFGIFLFLSLLIMSRELHAYLILFSFDL